MDIITLAFNKILESKTIASVDKILDELRIEEANRINDSVYPRLTFKITKEEINGLKEKGVISANNQLAELKSADPLTKLLYAIAWKNGDLRKIKHIIKGITSMEPGEGENALVFYHFGKFLANDDEPIVDQHILRAFGIFKAKGNTSEITRLKRLTQVSKKEKDLIEQYKFWLRTDLTQELRGQNNYAYHVDKVLFALGKSVKVKKVKLPHNG